MGSPFHAPGCDCQAHTERRKLTEGEGWSGAVSHPFSSPPEQAFMIGDYVKGGDMAEPE